MLSAMAGCVLRGIVFSIAEEEAPSVLSTEYHGHGSSPSPFGTQQQVLLPIWNPPVFIFSAGAVGLLLAAAIRSTFPSYPIRVLLRGTSALLPPGPSERRGEVTVSVQPSFGMPSDAARHSLPSQPIATRRMNPRLVPIPYQRPPSQDLVHQANGAIQSIRHMLDSTITIIIMCNGALAVAEELREMLLPSPIYTAFTTHGADRESFEDHLPHLVHAGYGEIVVHQCSAMAHLLNDCGLNARLVESSTEMQYRLWQKLAANAVVNPLTALYQCSNGALYDAVPQFVSHYLPGIVDEVVTVYRAVTDDEPTSSDSDDARLVLDYVVEVVHGIACPIQMELYQRLFPPGDSADR